MKQLLSAAALGIAAFSAQAGTNLLSAELQNVAISFTDLNPADSHVPGEGGGWQNGRMALELSHTPQAGTPVQLNNGSVRVVPAPQGDPLGLLALAPYTAVSLSADYRLSYQLADGRCFDDGSCPFAALDASLLMTERLRQPWETSFEGADGQHIVLDARELPAGLPLLQTQTGHLSLTFTNDTDEVRYLLPEVSLGLGLGVQAAQAVPEPATAALLGAGLAGLALRRRRPAKAAA